MIKKYLEFINENTKDDFKNNRDFILKYLTDKSNNIFKDYNLSKYGHTFLTEHWAKNNLTNYNNKNYNYDIHLEIHFYIKVPTKEYVETILNNYIKNYKITTMLEYPGDNLYDLAESRFVISFNLEENMESNIFKSVKSLKKFNL